MVCILCGLKLVAEGAESDFFLFDVNGQPSRLFGMGQFLLHLVYQVEGARVLEIGVWVLEMGWVLEVGWVLQMEALFLTVIKLSNFLAEVIFLELILVNHLTVNNNTFDPEFRFRNLNSLMVQLIRCVVIQEHQVK